MDTDSPISLDLGFPFPSSNQPDLHDGQDGMQTNHGLSGTSTRGQHTGSIGFAVSGQHRASIDAVFDQDGIDQWSPIHEDQHGRTGSTASANFENIDGSADRKLGDDGKPPSWSELKTKAGKERKRLPLACIDCRRKKIKCSGEKPACKHCVKARVPCVYKNTARKAAPRTDYMAMLDKRLKRMEDRVIKMIPKEDAPDFAVTGRSSIRPPVPGQPVKKEKVSAAKRSAEDAFTVELNEWGQQKKTPAPESSIQSRSQREFETKLSTDGADALPPTHIQEHLAELFFDCVYGQSYLLLHKPSFMRKLKAGAVPPVLVLAVCAISARFSTHPQVSSEPAFLRGEQWATPARNIVEKRHFEPNITILTTMLILGLHFFGTCEGGLSWSFGGQAMRLGYALQLHRELDQDPLGRVQAERAADSGQAVPAVPELSFTDREIRRRLMWACYLMDIFNSSGTERPSFLSEEYIRIQLPIKESHFQQEIAGLTENLEGNVTLLKDFQLKPDDAQVEAKSNLGVAAYVIRTVMVWKKVVQYLNLGGKDRDPHPIWDPLSRFASLQRQIQQLKAGLPDDLQYTPENLAIHVSDRLANQFLFLHIVLAQTNLFLHRFAIPTAPNVHRPYPPNTPKAFLATCATTVVESASLVSKYLADSTGHTLTVPFAGYCAYAAATVHVWGIFSKHPALEAASKENLRHNYRYLTRMKRFWGMFHYMAESIKEIYRAFNEVANVSKGRPKLKSSLSKDTTAAIDSVISADPSRAASPSIGDSNQQDGQPSIEQNGSSSTENLSSNPKTIFQYGDWFDRYPHGVSKTEWDATKKPYKQDTQKGNEAVMSQKSDLQSVEEFFASLNPPSKAVAADKDRDRAAALAAALASGNSGPGGRGKKIARRRGKSVHENVGSGAFAKSLMNPASTSAQDPPQSKDGSVGTQGQQQQRQHQQQSQSQSQPQSQQQSQPRVKSMSGSFSAGQQQRTQRIGSESQTQVPSTQNQFADRSTAVGTNAGVLDLNTSDIDIPMSDFGTGSQQQRLQSQAANAFDMHATDSPSYFNPSSQFTSGLTPVAHRQALDFDYNSPSTASNPGSTTNPQSNNPMNFNFNYTSALPHLDRQMVFGAYADVDPSNNVDNSQNLDFWGNPWNNMNSAGGGSIDIDGFGAFDDVNMSNIGAAPVKNKSPGIVTAGVRNNSGSGTSTGNRNRSGFTNQTDNGGNGFPSAGELGDVASGLESTAWFMPFNIEPPMGNGFEDFGSFDGMDMSGGGNNSSRQN